MFWSPKSLEAYLTCCKQTPKNSTSAHRAWTFLLRGIIQAGIFGIPHKCKLTLLCPKSFFPYNSSHIIFSLFPKLSLSPFTVFLLHHLKMGRKLADLFFSVISVSTTVFLIVQRTDLYVYMHTQTYMHMHTHTHNVYPYAYIHRYMNSHTQTIPSFPLPPPHMHLFRKWECQKVLERKLISQETCHVLFSVHQMANGKCNVLLHNVWNQLQ